MAGILVTVTSLASKLVSITAVKKAVATVTRAQADKGIVLSSGRFIRVFYNYWVKLTNRGTPAATSLDLSVNTHTGITTVVDLGTNSSGAVFGMVSGTNLNSASAIIGTDVNAARAIKSQTNLVPQNYSLDLDFTNGTLSPLITFTRSDATSCASYYDSTGVLRIAAANTPRFDYDPVTLESRGLLVEESRTNLLTYSEQFDNGVWLKGNGSTVTANATTSPDGTLTADAQFEVAVTGQHYVYSTFNFSAATYTFSMYLKANGRQWCRLSIQDASDLGAFFDIKNGVVGNIDAGITATITAVSSGFYRCTVTRTMASAVLGYLNFYGASSNGTLSYSGSITNGAYLWGAQLEAGAFATSYIPTVASTVTRAADIASITGTNFSSWFSTSAGTLFAHFDVLSTTQALGMAIASLDTGAVNGYLLYKSSGSNSLTGYTGTSLSYLGTVTANVFAKAVVAYDGIANGGTFNGLTPTAITAVAVTTPTQLLIGRSCGASPLSGHVKRVTYYPYRLQNSQLQLITDNNQATSDTSVAGTNIGTEINATRALRAISTTSPLASLDLDFTSEVLDPRITFSRTSNATVTGSDGLIQYAPHNLLTYSEQFDNAAWIVTGSTISANSTVAPDGTTTADKVQETATTGQHLVSQTATVGASASYSMSVYVKAAERSVLRLTEVSSTAAINFDLSLGSITSSSLVTNPQITAVGNGWYRVSGTFTSSGVSAQIAVYPIVGGTSSYLGVVGSGFFVWGAQLSQGTRALTYTPTTSAAVYGPRFDYDPAILVQQNLLKYSEQIDNAVWSKSGSYIQTNLLTYSEQFDNAVWGKAPGITATGNKITFGSAFNSYVTETVSLLASTTYTLSVVVQVTSGTISTNNFQIAAYGAALSTVQTIAAPPTGIVTTLTLTFTTNATGGSANIGIRCDELTPVTITATAQLNYGSTAQPYRATTSTALPVLYLDPLGRITAQKVVEIAQSGITHYVNQSTVDTVVSGAQVTYSVYLKSGERTQWMVRAFGGGAITTTKYVCFDTTAETIWLTNLATGTITSVGGGWYRCTVTFTTDTAGAFNVGAMLCAAGVNTYLGDDTSGGYVWGAQVNVGSTALPYFATTSSGQSFYSPKGLLIEESRTNLLTYSEQFDNAAWTNSNTTVTANTVVAPDGNTTVDKLVETAVSGIHSNQQATSAVMSPGTYTLSIYAKAAERSKIILVASNTTVESKGYDLTSGTLFTSDLSAQSSRAIISNVGNGFYRCSVTFDLTVSSQIAYRVYICNSAGSSNYVGDGTSGVYIWGAQLEAGAFTTSYIPTVAAQVTRSADNASMTGTNFSSWYNAAEGSLYSEWDTKATSGMVVSTSLINTLDSAQLSAHRLVVGLDNRISYRGPGALVDDISQSPVVSGPFKYSNSYSISSLSLAFSSNGRAATTGAIQAVATFDKLIIGSATTTTAGSQTIKRISYYPTKLPDPQLQLITTTGQGITDISISTANIGTETNALHTLPVTNKTIPQNSVLDLDFTKGTLDPRITFTRSSTGTYTNSSGVLSFAAINQPRFDYDPVTLTPKGLLIEDSRTNLLTYSEQFDNAVWSTSFATRTANTTVSPDGTAIADTITATNVSFGGLVRTNATYAASTTYTLSVYAKAGTATRVGLRPSGQCVTASDQFPWFDLTTGVFTTITPLSGTIVSGSATNVGNSWWRLTVVYTTPVTVPATTTDIAIVSATGGTNYIPVGTETVFLWGAQLEAGAFATSYIRTGSVAVTRALDWTSITGTNFSSWYRQDEGTVYAEASTFYLQGSGSTVRFSDNTDANALSLYYQAGLVRARVYYQSTIPLDLSTSPLVLSSNTYYKSAIAYKYNDTAISLPGGVQTSNSVSIPTFTRLDIGILYWGGVLLNGHIKRLVYYPRRLSNSELQLLTDSVETVSVSPTTSNTVSPKTSTVRTTPAINQFASYYLPQRELSARLEPSISFSGYYLTNTFKDATNTQVQVISLPYQNQRTKMYWDFDKLTGTIKYTLNNGSTTTTTTLTGSGATSYPESGNFYTLADGYGSNYLTTNTSGDAYMYNTELSASNINEIFSSQG